jgi:hypothetical protein
LLVKTASDLIPNKIPNKPNFAFPGQRKPEQEEEGPLMHDQETGASLTESRIRRILELEPMLRRRTRRDAKRFLDVPRLPDMSRGETLIDVVAPQMSEYFADCDEDPAQFFRDRSRMLMIFLAINAGGVRTLMEKYSQLATGELLRSAISNMRKNGFGSRAAEGMLSQATKNADDQVRQLQSVKPEEEESVKNCMKEIEEMISRRHKK